MNRAQKNTTRPHPDWQFDPLKGAWYLTALFWACQAIGALLCRLGVHKRERGCRHSWCARGCGWGQTHAHDG